MTIQLDQVTKSYAGARRPVISDVSLTVVPGEVVWVSGASGSGKTTLLNVLGLLTGADSGRYLIDGVDMITATTAARQRARREVISTVFQRGNLFPHLTTLDNVLVGMSAGGVAEAMGQLERVGLAAKARQLAGLLSGGEQGRVAIARAAARKTPVLLADEPIAGLDDTNIDLVLGLIEESAEQGATVVVVSHDSRAERVATSRLDLQQLAA